MGFCLINNVAVAAAHALHRGLRRVTIIDWDVHHGNGTQEMFWRDPRVLYVSLHQWPFYPGTGSADEIGEGDGRGFTMNVPLSAGAEGGDYAAAFDRWFCRSSMRTSRSWCSSPPDTMRTVTIRSRA